MLCLFNVSKIEVYAARFHIGLLTKWIHIIRYGNTKFQAPPVSVTRQSRIGNLAEQDAVINQFINNLGLFQETLLLQFRKDFEITQRSFFSFRMTFTAN